MVKDIGILTFHFYKTLTTQRFNQGDLTADIWVILGFYKVRVQTISKKKTLPDNEILRNVVARYTYKTEQTLAS